MLFFQGFYGLQLIIDFELIVQVPEKHWNSLAVNY